VAKQRNDAQLWLRQAADDYRFGRLALANEFHAQACFACFIAQQAAEKAVKAVAYHLGMRPVVGHSIHALLKRLNARGRVTEKLLVLGGELDQYYIATRYPDALPGVTPSDAFSGAQARAALRAARRILSWTQAHLREK
jgi:HEPN domain-containing protein